MLPLSHFMRSGYLVISILLLTFCSCKQSGQLSASYEDITVTDAASLFRSGSVKFLDVRTPQEIAAGKIGTAVCIDYRSQSFADKVGKLNKHHHYVVYCKSGGRSAKASEMMQNMGFKNVNNLLGGYSAWQEEDKN